MWPQRERERESSWSWANSGCPIKRGCPAYISRCSSTPSVTTSSSSSSVFLPTLHPSQPYPKTDYLLYTSDLLVYCLYILNIIIIINSSCLPRKLVLPRPRRPLATLPTAVCFDWSFCTTPSRTGNLGIAVVANICWFGSYRYDQGCHHECELITPWPGPTGGVTSPTVTRLHGPFPSHRASFFSLSGVCCWLVLLFAL